MHACACVSPTVRLVLSVCTNVCFRVCTDGEGFLLTWTHVRVSLLSGLGRSDNRLCKYPSDPGPLRTLTGFISVLISALSLFFFFIEAIIS